MDFNLNDDQLAIRDVVDRIFADLCSDDAIRAAYSHTVPFQRDLWQQLADAGVLGASLPETAGGSALGFTETCLLLEAQGRSVAPLPLLETVVECALPLARHADLQQVGDTLAAVSRGECLLTSLRPYRGLQGHAPLTARTQGRDIRLSGTTAAAPWAPLAERFLVEVEDTAGTPLALLLDGEGIARTGQTLIGGITAATLDFADVAVPSTAVVARGDAARMLLDTQRCLAYTGLAALQVGVLEEGLKRTAAYDNERKQFGRPLSSFQAVAHQAADAYMEIEALRGVYWRALDDIEHGRDARLAAHAAKYWVCRAGHRVAHTVLHLHGGMGQDLEYPIHRFFTWAKRNERYLGAAAEHSRQIGALIARDGGRALSLVA